MIKIISRQGLLLLTRTTAICSWIVLPTMAANSADTPPSSANQLLSEQFGPFKFSLGQDSTGGFGANLDGQGRTTFGHVDKGDETEGTPNKAWFWYFPNLSYSVNGTWSSTQSATNNASLSLKPGIDGLVSYGAFNDPSFHAKSIHCDSNGTNCVDESGKPIGLATYPSAILGLGSAADAELKYGTIKQNGTTVTTRQLLVGGDVYFVIPRHWDFGFARDLASPRISETFYHPTNTNTTTSISVPSGVTANYLQTEVQTVLGFGRSNEVKLDVKYDGSKPTGSSGSNPWQNLWTVKLWVPALKFNGVNPSITYQSGANAGFSYDRQVILGVLVDFLDPKSTK